MVRFQTTGVTIPRVPGEPREAFLAGLPCAGIRSLTRTETIVLAAVGYGGAAIGIAAGVVIFDLIFRAPWVQSSLKNALIWALVSVPALIFAFSLAGPAIMTLRRGMVTVYRGRGRNLGGFDRNQAILSRGETLPVEVVMMADGRTPLRVNEAWCRPMGRLRPPARVARDRGPDTRPLTEGELLELDDLVRHYRRPTLAAFREVVWIPLVGLLLTSRLWSHFDASFAIFGAILLVVAIAVVFCRTSSYLSFARTLRQDRKDAVLTGGCLWSGLPWIVNGEPAPWRLVRPAVGAQSLDLEKLEALGY